MYSRNFYLTKPSSWLVFSCARLNMISSLILRVLKPRRQCVVLFDPVALWPGDQGGPCPPYENFV